MLLDDLGDDPFTLEQNDRAEDFAFFRRMRDCGRRVEMASNVAVAHIEDGLAFAPGRAPGKIIDGRLDIADTRTVAEITAEYDRKLGQVRTYGPHVDAAVKREIKMMRELGMMRARPATRRMQLA